MLDHRLSSSENKSMNKLQTVSENIKGQMDVIKQAIEKPRHTEIGQCTSSCRRVGCPEVSEEPSKKCVRCGNEIEYKVVTDHSSEGDGMTAEVEKGHSEDCERID